MDYYIGKLFSEVLEDHSLAVPEGGIFEAEVYMTKAILEHSNDVKGLIQNHIAMTLASAVQITKVPKEFWSFQLNEELATKLNWPQLMFFGRRQK